MATEVQVGEENAVSFDALFETNEENLFYCRTEWSYR